jgi:hypothetical protein
MSRLGSSTFLAISVALAGCRENAALTGRPAAPAPSFAGISALSFEQLSVGHGYSCALTDGHEIYC